MSINTSRLIAAIQGSLQVQMAAITAGLGLLGKLEQAAGFTQVGMYKLEQLQRIVYKRTYVLVTENLLPKLKQQRPS